MPIPYKTKKEIMRKNFSIAIAIVSLMAVSSPSFAQFDLGKLKDAVKQMQGTVEKKVESPAPTVAPATNTIPVQQQPQAKQQTTSSQITQVKNDSPKVLNEPKSLNPEDVDASLEGKVVRINAKIEKNGKIVYAEFDRYLIEGCDAIIKGMKPNSTVSLIGTAGEINEGGIGQNPAPASLSINNCKIVGQETKDKLIPVTSAVPSDNPSIESWAKTCSPFTAPIDLEKQISQGKITFRGIKVAAVDSVDSGTNSLVTIRMAMSFTDFKTQYPEFSRKSRIPKSKTCALGGTRSLAEQSFTGVKGATIECNCMTGGD
jgi:biotin carboxyl carrier protein